VSIEAGVHIPCRLGSIADHVRLREHVSAKDVIEGFEGSRAMDLVPGEIASGGYEFYVVEMDAC
jgi:hypothetical protein